MFDNWTDAMTSFDEMLNEGGPVIIMGQEFDKARILREIDPISYRSNLFDYIDGCGIDSDNLQEEGYDDLP